MRQILETTQATGSVFMVRGGAPTFSGPQDLLSRQQVLLDTHAGGVWTLQVKSPGDVWIDTDIAFSDMGVKAFWGSPELEYRLSGGTVGTRAYATGVWRAA